MRTTALDGSENPRSPLWGMGGAAAASFARYSSQAGTWGAPATSSSAHARPLLLAFRPRPVYLLARFLVIPRPPIL